MTVEEQLKRWTEHFRELLNRLTPELLPDIPLAVIELPISCEKPTKTEIKKAIMTLRNGKSGHPKCVMGVCSSKQFIKQYFNPSLPFSDFPIYTLRNCCLGPSCTGLSEEGFYLTKTSSSANVLC